MLIRHVVVLVVVVVLRLPRPSWVMTDPGGMTSFLLPVVLVP